MPSRHSLSSSWTMMCPSSRYALASHQLCVGMCVGAYDSYAHTSFKRVSVLVDLLLHENNLSQTHVSFVERDVLLPTNVMIICHYKRHIVMLSCAACHTPSGTQPQVCPPQIVSVRSKRPQRLLAPQSRTCAAAATPAMAATTSRSASTASA